MTALAIVVTGSAGRIGSAICRKARQDGHRVIGIDRIDDGRSIAADIGDTERMAHLFDGADAVIHCAGLHAPHVGLVPDRDFLAANVDGTASIVRAVRRAGVARLVLASSTAVLGGGSAPGEPARWIDDRTEPRARTIYHATKLEAEALVRDAAGPRLGASIVRLGRCFPEEPRLVAFYRLCRGIGEDDAAQAHLSALAAADETCQPLIACATTPFRRADAAELGRNAPTVIARRCPQVAAAFAAKGWMIPQRTDRVYDNALARERWRWAPTPCTDLNLEATGPARPQSARR